MMNNPMINESILQQKIHSLSQYPILDKKSVKKFGEILKTLDDWSLFRINPRRFAKQHGFNNNESIDIFVHGAKIGLFDLSYHFLCSACHGILHNHHSLAELENNSFHCAICDIDINTSPDDLVEVSFTIQPSVKQLNINPFSTLENYSRYYFSANYQDSEQVKAFFKENVIKGFIVLMPDELQTISLDIASHQIYQIVSIENNTSFTGYFSENGTIQPFLEAEESWSVKHSQGLEKADFNETKYLSPVSQNNEASHQTTEEQRKSVEIDLLPTAFIPSRIVLPFGFYELQVKNHTNNTVGCLVMRIDDREKIHALFEKYPSTFTPFLTAKMLLNNQSFRDLFRVQQLSETFNVNVKNLTIMFTDLRGSTEMYDKAGDIFAYKLVQTHFKILTEIVRKFSGVIVKTMGDAIMATFSRPLDGFLASLEMLNKIEQMNQTVHDANYQIGLKVGINEGPALAVVNDERIDYFGQSVNVAARVQGLAQAGEIWISQPVFESPGVMEKLVENHYQTEQHSATLKGVGQPTIVHKIFK
jgi:class 3 adenylate cyclase